MADNLVPEKPRSFIHNGDDDTRHVTLQGRDSEQTWSSPIVDQGQLNATYLASSSTRRYSCLVVGNYCHDVLFKDNSVITESIGGATSFISSVLDGFNVASCYVSKVGPDFAYPVTHRPLVSSSSRTTVFHAYFSSEIKRQDRILKRVRACEPISPCDLPNSKFDFGLAVGVGGEILPETLERMIDICKTVLVDIQALIRIFDPADGTVNHVDLNQTGFFYLLPRIGFLKASSDEAPFLDVEEVRKQCCVVLTNGNEGCMVFTKDSELKIAPFPTIQVDPTGAGDSFLGGLVTGLTRGLTVPDSALLGNLFGSLTVGQMGHSKFDPRLVQRVKEEVDKRREDHFDGLQFFRALDAARSSSLAGSFLQKSKRELPNNTSGAKCNDQSLLPSICEKEEPHSIS
ncbi:unnamed protein product [Cuscuta epithymum]|uniref:Carbohydrate kinase PfkB domain-containing protein n=2 Tax=Cuscuta epithymum TaxID=186058 RepID=A0AAV0CH20_9ASTE|nr:unnamed protein product [Cuscuta epithymum]